MTTTLADEVAMAIDIEMQSDGDEIDADRLKENLLKIMAKQSAFLEASARQLSSLIGEYSQLTIPLSDGCVARVKFSLPITRKHMIAFSKTFAAIAENYVVDEDAVQ